MLTRQRQVQFETNLLLNVGLSRQTTYITPNWILHLETEAGGTNDDDKNASGRTTQRSYILGRVEQLLDTKDHTGDTIGTWRRRYVLLLFGTSIRNDSDWSLHLADSKYDGC